MKKSILYAVLALALASCGCPDNNVKYGPRVPGPIVSDETTVAETIYGKIQGVKDGDVYEFKGIPYAKAERFMPPQAPDKHEGVKICRTYGPKTPQTSTSLAYRPDPSDYGFGFQFNLEPVDENKCHVLNVWTKGLDNAKRPVFIWIHGGGFASGSGYDMDCYEGRALAEKGDIVVVNLNHRLNVLGYIDLRGLGGKYSESVNLGMQDLVKALEWVRDNIEAFGGDPDNVTIAGQSGGGGKVNTLMAMPSAMGLFHKAIAQSGSWVLHNNDADGKALGMAVMDELGVTPANAEKKLASFTYEELARAGSRATAKLRSSSGFCPTVDGKYLIDPAFDDAAPEISRNIPMIIGSNKNEFVYDNSPVMTQAEAEARLVKLMGQEKAMAYVKAYGKAYPGHTPQEMLYTDSFLRKAAVKMADMKSAQNAADVYMYFFTWKPTNNALGACHGMELPFMFNNIALQRDMTGGTLEAYKLADLISSAWISFIRTGNPNVKGLPKWEPYTAENGNTMIFDNECTIVHNHDRGLMEFDLPRHF